MPALCPRDANNSMVRHKQVHWRVTRQRKHLKGRLKATFLSQLPLYGVEIHRWFNCFTWLSFISLFHIRELCVCVLVLIDSQRVRLRFRKLIYLFTPPPPIVSADCCCLFIGEHSAIKKKNKKFRSSLSWCPFWLETQNLQESVHTKHAITSGYLFVCLNCVVDIRQELPTSMGFRLKLEMDFLWLRKTCKEATSPDVVRAKEIRFGSVEDKGLGS